MKELARGNPEMPNQEQSHQLALDDQNFEASDYHQKLFATQPSFTPFSLQRKTDVANWIFTSRVLFTGVVYLEDTPDAPSHFLYASLTMCGRKPERFILSENPLPIVSCSECVYHPALRFL